MTPQPNDIWTIQVSVGKSSDIRPCIVLNVGLKVVTPFHFPAAGFI